MESPSTLPTPQHNPPAGNPDQQAAHPTPLLTVFQKLIKDPLFHKALYLKTPSPQKKPKQKNANDSQNKAVHVLTSNWKMHLKGKLILITQGELVPKDDYSHFTKADVITYFLLNSRRGGEGKMYSWFPEVNGTGKDEWEDIVKNVNEKVENAYDMLPFTDQEIIIYILANSNKGIDSVLKDGENGDLKVESIKELSFLQNEAAIVRGETGDEEENSTVVPDSDDDDVVPDDEVDGDGAAADGPPVLPVALAALAEAQAEAQALAAQALAAQALAAQAPALISPLPPQELLREMTKPKLQALLWARNLPTGGNKLVLLGRLGVLPREGTRISSRPTRKPDRLGDYE